MRISKLFSVICMAALVASFVVRADDTPAQAAARAALEATAFQTREVVEAMELDSGITLDVLRTDGGMVGNELLMQFQADILDRPVVRPATRETTALGAAYASACSSSTPSRR